MDIDSFYQDGDMTFGMDGRIYFADDAEFYNARGGRKAKQRATGRAEEVQKSYPITDNCGELALHIANIKQSILDSETKLAGKIGRGDRRVTTDYLNAMRNHRTNLEAKQRELKCLEKQEKEELGSFMSQLQQTTAAGATTSTATNSDKTSATTYILLGVGGLALLGITIFVIKKVNK